MYAGAVGRYQEQRPRAGAGRVGAGQLPEREAGHALRQLKCMGLVPRRRRQAMMTGCCSAVGRLPVFVSPSYDDSVSTGRSFANDC